MRRPELHLAVRLVIVGIAVAFVLASMLWMDGSARHAKRQGAV